MWRIVVVFLVSIHFQLLASKRFLSSLHLASISSILPSIHLVVIATPHLSQQPQFYLAMSMKGRIDCPLESDPPATSIQWVKDGRPVAISNWGRVRVSYEGNLLIKTVLASDEGTYLCVAYSPMKPRIESPTVRVLVRDVPHFVITPRPIYQRQPMQLVALPCASDANPQPSISWKKINGSFPSTTRTLQNGGNLTIARLTRDDQGVYECVATNPVASISTTTLLLIESAACHGPHSVTVETTYQSATISWHPAYDEGFPIHQLLWYRRLEEESILGDNSNASSAMSSHSLTIWETMEVVPNDTATLTLHNLRENSSYQFSIQARLYRTGQLLTSDTVTAQTKSRPVSPKANHAEFVSGGSERVTSGFHGDSSGLPPIPGLLPLRPVNVTVLHRPDGLLISWFPPVGSPLLIKYYVLEYRTVGHWVPLASQVNPWYLWKTVSRGVNYQFRVISAAESSRFSEPSPSVTYFSTGGASGVSSEGIGYGVLCLILAAIVAVLGSVLVAVLSLKTMAQRRKLEATKYVSEKASEQNYNTDAAEVGLQPEKVDRHDSLMTSVMDDVVGMLAFDLQNNLQYETTEGLSTHRFRLEEAV